MIQVKIEIHGGSGGAGWSIELERAVHTFQTASEDVEPGQAREVLQKLFREVDGLLRDRMPAGPPKSVPCCLDKR